MPHLISRPILITGLFLGALSCSDDSSDPPANNGGTAGAGGAAGSSGSAGTAGAASGGSAGTAGAAGAAGMAGASGAGGFDAADAGGDSGFPTPDKLVSLTFDDGPNVALTGAVLDKLEAHDVPASFFLVGQNISETTRPVLERAASLGCTFENHSLDFASLTGLTEAEIDAKVNPTTELIQQFTGAPPAFFRAPNLQVDPPVFAAIDLPFAAGILVGDYPGGNNGGTPTVESVTNIVLTQVQDGSIVLMHDVQPGLNPQVTPPALDIIIPELKSQGYEFVTLRELFARRGVDPNTRQDANWDVVPPTP